MPRGSSLASNVARCPSWCNSTSSIEDHHSPLEGNVPKGPVASVGGTLILGERGNDGRDGRDGAGSSGGGRSKGLNRVDDHDGRQRKWDVFAENG